MSPLGRPRPVTYPLQEGLRDSLQAAGGTGRSRRGGPRGGALLGGAAFSSLQGQISQRLFHLVQENKTGQVAGNVQTSAGEVSKRGFPIPFPEPFLPPLATLAYVHRIQWGAQRVGGQPLRRTLEEVCCIKRRKVHPVLRYPVSTSDGPDAHRKPLQHHPPPGDTVPLGLEVPRKVRAALLD